MLCMSRVICRDQIVPATIFAFAQDTELSLYVEQMFAAVCSHVRASSSLGYNNSPHS